MDIAEHKQILHKASKFTSRWIKLWWIKAIFSMVISGSKNKVGWKYWSRYYQNRWNLISTDYSESDKILCHGPLREGLDLYASLWSCKSFVRIVATITSPKMVESLSLIIGVTLIDRMNRWKPLRIPTPISVIYHWVFFCYVC